MAYWIKAFCKRARQNGYFAGMRARKRKGRPEAAKKAVNELIN
jgi:hypothetical protein